jgi:hypothetical protein
MTTAATLPEVRTPPPANGKDLETEITNIAAPKHDGNNLLIRIDVGSEKAKFHCREQENVGDHTQRHVFFCANEHCWLIFDPPSAFIEPYLELVKGEEISAHVADSTLKAETGCVVRVERRKTVKSAKMTKTASYTMRPPVIVVP